MEKSNVLLDILSQEYDTLKLLKQSERSRVSVIRHRRSGTRYVFRQFEGSSEVYQKLLTISCPNLPQIYEVMERDGKTTVLEEYIQGDTLSYLLAGDLLTVSEAKRVMMQLCSALWVLHSMGAVHRDIKPENVIIRGSETVLRQADAWLYAQKISEGDEVLLSAGKLKKQ